jgi:hypothetical protein
LFRVLLLHSLLERWTMVSNRDTCQEMRQMNFILLFRLLESQHFGVSFTRISTFWCFVY